MKKTVIALYIVVIAVMAIATIVEKYQGTEYVSETIYGAWWFSALWALLTATAVFYFVRRRVRRPSVVMLHLSFVVILAGALLTHLTAIQGVVHLRMGEPTDRYLTPDLQEHPLPFTISLKHFYVQYHEGTEAPSDFISQVEISDAPARESASGGLPATISMNRIATHKGFRLYQSSYDEDMQGSILALNSDPWGIPLTYAGYALLFIALLWMLIDPKGTFRRLLKATGRKGDSPHAAPRGRDAALCRLCIGLCLLSPGSALLTPMHAAPRVLPEETAERFARLYVVHNDRVCPMETYALDFTKKLFGKRKYGDYSAAQVLTGYIFFYDDWRQEPLKDDKHNDEREILIASIHSGRPLKIFPYAALDTLHHVRRTRITWYAPTDHFGADVDEEHQKYFRDVFTRLNGEIQAGNYDRADKYLDMMLKYQVVYSNHSLPSATQVKAEHIYNKVPFATILFMVCLTLGLLSFLLLVFGKRYTVLEVIAMTLCLTALTLCLALRWIITGHIPMANGYETMLFMAWAVMVLALMASRRFPVMLTFGFLLAGFFLLVSHISQMNPQMSHLMPVLNSPLLTLHVSIIMMAFALLSLTFIASLTALLIPRQRLQLHLLGQLMLYPALTCLGFGIFIGAIWANVSWGTYWSWDPKETWALITFMVYAAPAHRMFSALSARPRTMAYHLYMVLAFLTLLMTYFGVNYFLGGMHSYA